MGPLERAFCFHLQSQAFQEMWTDILSCTAKLFTSKHGVTSRKVCIVTLSSSVGQRSRCRRCVDGKCLYQRTILHDITNRNNKLNIDLRCNPKSYIIFHGKQYVSHTSSTTMIDVLKSDVKF